MRARAFEDGDYNHLKPAETVAMLGLEFGLNLGLGLNLGVGLGRGKQVAAATGHNAKRASWNIHQRANASQPASQRARQN